MDLGWLPSLGFYILGILIIGLTFRMHLRKANSSSQEKLANLLQEEQNARFVRASELKTELFIQVDFLAYPSVTHKACAKKYQELMSYAKRPMMNLQKFSNLELKQTYGPQVLEKIAAYEKNYFGFMDISIQYGEILYENNYLLEARKTLEQCIRYHCDISKCYILLIKIYKAQNDVTALNHIKTVIEKEMGHSPLLHKVLQML